MRNGKSTLTIKREILLSKILPLNAIPNCIYSLKSCTKNMKRELLMISLEVEFVIMNFGIFL